MCVARRVEALVATLSTVYSTSTNINNRIKRKTRRDTAYIVSMSRSAQVCTGADGRNSTGRNIAAAMMFGRVRGLWSSPVCHRLSIHGTCKFVYVATRTGVTGVPVSPRRWCLVAWQGALSHYRICAVVPWFKPSQRFGLFSEHLWDIIGSKDHIVFSGRSALLTGAPVGWTCHGESANAVPPVPTGSRGWPSAVGRQ